MDRVRNARAYHSMIGQVLRMCKDYIPTHVQCLPHAICQDTSVVATASSTGVLFCHCCCCRRSISCYLYIMATSNQSGPPPSRQPSTSGKSALYSKLSDRHKILELHDARFAIAPLLSNRRKFYSLCAPQPYSLSLHLRKLAHLIPANWDSNWESIRKSSKVGGQLTRLAALAALIHSGIDIPPLPGHCAEEQNLAW